MPKPSKLLYCREAWIKALAALNAQEQGVTCPELDERVALPDGWATLLSKEQLGAFLAFLKLPASSQEIKANLVQHVLMRLEADKVAKAQFFEVFAFELAVPPWELETLLGCTTTERKRWTEEQKLPVLGYGSFRKAGSDHAYPLYDRRVILVLTSGAWLPLRRQPGEKAGDRRNRRTGPRDALRFRAIASAFLLQRQLDSASTTVDVK